MRVVSDGLGSRNCTPIPIVAAGSTSSLRIHTTRARTEKVWDRFGRVNLRETCDPGWAGWVVEINIPPRLRFMHVPRPAVPAWM
jgi:hypothetical protein